MFVINAIYRDICDNIDKLFVFSNDKNNYSKITDKVHDITQLNSLVYNILNTNNVNNLHTMIIIDTLITKETLRLLTPLLINNRIMNITIVLVSQMLTDVNPAMISTFNNIIFNNNDDHKAHINKLWQDHFIMHNEFSLFNKNLKNLDKFEFMIRTNTNIYTKKATIHHDHIQIETENIENNSEIAQLKNDVNNAINLLIAIRNRLTKLK